MTDDETLGCGASVVELVDQVDAGRLEPTTDHQRHCSTCAAALSAAATTAAAVGLVRSTRGPLPAGLVDRVLTEVRRGRVASAPIELAPGVQPGRPVVTGGVRVHRQVVADLARVAAAQLRGVTVARSAVDQDAAGGLRVALGLLLDGRRPLPEVARTVRHDVREALSRALGPVPVSVELAALDLLPPDRPQLLDTHGVQPVSNGQTHPAQDRLT